MLPDLPENDPGLRITAPAVEHIRRSIAKLKDKRTAIGLRVGVRKAGCSGYEYTLEYAFEDSPKVIDFAFKVADITILIDKITYLKFFKGGTQMDYRKEGVNEGLQFDNPNVGHQCGCGESFTLIDEE